MSDLEAAMLSAVVAGAVCTPVLVVLVPLLRHHAVLDTPSARSSHSVPTPRGGGVALALAICCAPLVVDRTLPTVLTAVGVLLAAVLGLVEDLRGVAIGRRLAVQALVGLVLASLLVAQVQAWWVIPAAVLIVPLSVAVINAVNFMDGINGISSATGVVAGLTYAVVGAYADSRTLVVLGAATAAAAAAFAPWNVPRARVFLGDVGSYGLGAALAGCLAVALSRGVPVEAVLAPLALYLADTGAVLVRRAVRRERLGEPHRQHAYQRLTDGGLSHTAVSGIVLLCSSTVCALGLVSLTRDLVPRLVADLTGAAVVYAYLGAPAWRRGKVAR